MTLGTREVLVVLFGSGRSCAEVEMLPRRGLIAILGNLRAGRKRNKTLWVVCARFNKCAIRDCRFEKFFRRPCSGPSSRSRRSWGNCARVPNQAGLLDFRSPPDSASSSQHLILPLCGCLRGGRIWINRIWSILSIKCCSNWQ